ncbi:MAG: hypothetical protein GY913_27370 [Proteobacteria bacterium]|nr:hypothetical protein [Pseudomonadota bacterium]MCP4920636.1 hypothetical protein [Pseudomonadota bacterium]
MIATFYLLLALPFILVPRGTREKLIWWTNTGASYGILRYALMISEIQVRGRENLPEYGRPYLVVANHRSFVDVLTLIWATRAEGISKRLVLYFPAMGVLGYLGGAVFFDRHDPASRAKALDDALFLMERGVPLHVYPEGTRTRDGRIRDRVHLGMLRAAHGRGIPVVPAALWGTDHVIPPSNKGIRWFQRVRLQIGEPLDPRDHPDATVFAEAGWDAVKQLVDDMETPEDEP